MCFQERRPRTLFTFDNDKPNRSARMAWVRSPFAWSLRSWRIVLAVVRAKWLCSPEAQRRGTDAMMAERVLVRRWRTQSLFSQRVDTVRVPGSGLPISCHAKRVAMYVLLSALKRP
jgi:hypothetical protein